MQKLKRTGLIILLLISIKGKAQQSELVKNYISQYKDLAITEMQRTGVPASIKLAQGILETMAGTSDLVIRSNNHFGIKCKSTWTGETVKHNDDERGECFRKYPSSEQSYKDHSDFLKGNQRYAFLFELDPTDYSGWAWGLKKAGYATNPRYAMALIKTIEDYGLQEYSFIALGRTPDKTTELADANPNPAPAVEKAVAVSDIPVKKEEQQSVENNSTAIKTEQPVSNGPVYPRGVFKINETKVIYVPKGSSYLAIAKEYDVDLAKVFEFNEIPRAEEVDRDRLIYLQRKRKTGNSEYHTVQPGESLHDIAQREAIRIESLLELNWLREGEVPAVGEQLSLHKKSSNVPKLALTTQYSILPGGNTRGTN